MADDAATTSRDYRETVFLPETPFPMRAGLPQKEPVILEAWAKADLYHAIRKARQRAGAPLFVLHDGPPYANGAIHIGHALQKTLKDFVVRSRFLLGYDVDYTPGWDCHGLPIEWKIEEELQAGARWGQAGFAHVPRLRRPLDGGRSRLQAPGRAGRLGDATPPWTIERGRDRGQFRKFVASVASTAAPAGDVEPGGAHSGAG
jgi:hypothetical protein